LYLLALHKVTNYAIFQSHRFVQNYTRIFKETKIPQYLGGVNFEKNTIFGAPGAGRTRNQLIRSQVLYPLSYEGNIRDYTRYYAHIPPVPIPG
jgi:hypothetical protein